MALPKLVKEGGSFYKGHKLVISADTGEYVLDMTETTATALNGIVIIPSKSGPGDTIKLEHLNASNERVSLLVEDLANIGAGVGWTLDFAAMEKMLANHKLRLTYLNAAGVAMDIDVSVERVK